MVSLKGHVSLFRENDDFSERLTKWPACAIGDGMDKLTFETALAELMVEYDKVAAKVRDIVAAPMWLNRSSTDAHSIGKKMEEIIEQIFRLKNVWAEARHTHEDRLND